MHDVKLKKMMNGGQPDKLKSAVADSTSADKAMFYAKKTPGLSKTDPGYIQELQNKLDAPGKVRKEIAKSKKK